MNDHEGKERSNLCVGSTNEQETDMQETELREYVEKRGWTYALYRDKGESGAKDNRPALNMF
jgi:DNA invertase Pin-like site-specific DNA recombinase